MLGKNNLFVSKTSPKNWLIQISTSDLIPFRPYKTAPNQPGMNLVVSVEG